MAEVEVRRLYEGARGTAVKILNRIERTDSYLDKVLDSELRSAELNDLDKALLTELVHGIMRWQLKLDWVLTGFFHGNFTKSDADVRNALRVALYQILFLDRIPPPAAVNEAVEFIKRIRGEKAGDFVNAVLRNILRNLDAIHYPDVNEDSLKYFSVMYSHPLWMVKRWVNRYGFDATEKLLPKNNERPPLTLRVNRLKTETSYFLSLLDANHIPYTKSLYLESFVNVQNLGNVSELEIFKQGFFTVQDESAGIACLLLSPQPGERVVDLCAAPGGKTAYIAELMGGKGEIIAIDKYESKVELIKRTCARLGIGNVQCIVADAITYQGPIADKVLLDAPCSGLGVLMKKPDIKWKREPEDIPKLAELQAQLLENAATLVKPGGVLVYSTCTIEPEENQELIQKFLEQHPVFTIDSAAKFVHPDLVTTSGWVETLPSKHQMDGTFAVRLVKQI